MKTILIILIAVLLSGCVTQRKCLRKFPPQVIKETVTVTDIVYRDTVIYVHIPADTITKEVTVYITEDGSNSELSELHTQLAWSTAQVVNGRLKHNLYQKPTEIERVIKNAVKEQSTHTIDTIVEVHREKYVPDIFKYSLAFSLLFIGYILFRLFKINVG